MKRIALSAAFLLAATTPVAAFAETATGTVSQSHCERTITQYPDGTIVTEESCTYYPDGSA